MASIVVAKLHPPLVIIGRQTLFGTVPPPTLSVPRTRQGHLAITAKATSESSESLSSPIVVKSVKNIWDKPEDLIAVIGLGIAATIGFWASSNFIAAIDRLPLIPGENIFAQMSNLDSEKALGKVGVRLTDPIT